MHKLTWMIALIVLTVALLPLGSSPVLAKDDPETSAEKMSTMLDLSTIEAVFKVQEKWVKGIEYPEGWVTLRSFSQALPEEYRKRLPMKDGWGEYYLFLRFEDSSIVLSKGEDRVQDFRIPDPEAERDEAEDRKMLDPGDDMVMGVGYGVLNEPSIPSSKMKRTLADMRSIGTAVELYAIDENVYPEQSRDLLPVELITPTLQPLYIKVLPVLDGWGQPLLYWSDSQQYIIISPGADYRIEPGYLLEEVLGKSGDFSGAFTDKNTDIVFVNGQFVQWPERTQQ